LKLLSLIKKEVSASNDVCEDETSKFVGNIGLTNGSPTWPGVVGRNVRDSLTKGEPPTITKTFPDKRE